MPGPMMEPMNGTLILIIFLTGTLVANDRVSDRKLTGSNGLSPIEETGTLTEGTISDVKLDQIMVTSSACLDPIRYFHGEGTIYVDENGDPISIKIVRPGVPVIVFYTQSENCRIANRVMVGTISCPPEAAAECRDAVVTLVAF